MQLTRIRAGMRRPHRKGEIERTSSEKHANPDQQYCVDFAEGPEKHFVFKIQPGKRDHYQPS
jgi:hypothetical protein